MTSRGVDLTRVTELKENAFFDKPITTDKVFAQFGLMLGIFPPFAVFSRFAFEIGGNPNDFWLILLLLVSNAVCGFAGYYSGKFIGKQISDAEKFSWSKMLLIVPFLGLLWGIITGAAGGIFIFVIGAFFGAAIASIIGAFAVTSMTIFHRLLKHGDVMDYRQFLPISLGITLAISALLLGLK